MITDADITKLKKTFATKNDADRRFDMVAENMAEMQSDIVTLKEDVSELKSDVADLKLDVAKLKSDVREIKQKVGLLDKIYNLLDRENAAIEENKMETAAAHHKLDRHETWIKHIAQETKVTLPH